jgi:hypothetical protein
MAITYNAGTNTITITAGTEGAMNSLQDVYDASVAGGWGAMSKQGSTQFRFDNEVRLVIGDGSTTTWFGDTNKLIEISDLAGTGWQIFMEKKANANIRFGTVISGKRTKDGCAFYHSPSGNAFTLIDSNHTSGVIDFFSCAFYVTVTAIYNCTGVRFYNCIAVGDLRILDNVTLDIYNYSMNNGYMISQNSTGTYDKIYGSDITYVTYIGTAAADLTFKNVTVLNNTYVARGYSTAKNLYMINFDVDTWAFTYSSYTGKFYRQYELDLKVIDKDNVAINAATVKIWDKDSNLVVDTTTNASGVIATQTITRGYYNQANGNTLQEASPHLIKIEKADYTTYEADFTLGDKIDWLIALQAAGGGLMRNPPMTGGMV